MNGFSKISPTDFPVTCTTGYRFSFNGKENDNEVKGVGNSIDFGARIYDSRLGRWLSIDPLAEKFSSWTPYNFVMDNPLNIVDPDGKDTLVVHRSAPQDGLGDSKTQIYVMTFSIIQNGVETVLPENGLIIGNKEYAQKIPYTALKEPEYTLKWQEMPSFPWLESTINITKGSYFHQGNDWEDFKGCYGMSFDRSISEFNKVSYLGNYTTIGITNTLPALKQVRGMYDQFNGPKQDQLTGEKFILRTNSVAEIKKIDPLPIKQIPTNDQVQE